jgi:restriction system protein
LTRDDVNLHAGQRLYRLDDNVRYKEGRRWFGRFTACDGAKALAWAFYLLLFGGLMTTGKDSRVLGVILLGLGLVCVVCAIVPGAVTAYRRKHPCPGLPKFEEALRRHHLYQIAAYEAEQERQKLKRSYWEFLDGYAFERATAEVLNKHRFNAVVTPGSGDGGVDIEITRNGLRGVVQCKAHVACVGPHVVRDLYGVIHHSGANFGIIVSRGGFTRGAVDFAKDKPILFLDTDDLIAMQEGRDVVAAAFSASSSGTRS